MASPESTMLLAGDLGGTNFRLEARSGGRTVFSTCYTDVGRFASLDSVLADAVPNLPIRPVATCIAVAGRVDDSGRRARVTNLGWDVSAVELEQLEIGRVTLINDFEATALGLTSLDAAELVSLSGVSRRDGDAVVLGPGTGLGVALRLFGKMGYVARATESGHQEWPARNDREWYIRQYIVAQKIASGHDPLTIRVSFEDIVSGPGLVSVYRALQHREGSIAGQANEGGRVSRMELPVAVAAGAREGDATCREALGVVFDSLAVLASDLALIGLPGGVYIVGGVVRKNLDLFVGERFLQVFQAKAPHEGMLKDTPVFLVQSDRELGVEGAALRATSLI